MLYMRYAMVQKVGGGASLIITVLLAAVPSLQHVGLTAGTLSNMWSVATSKAELQSL